MLVSRPSIRKYNALTLREWQWAVDQYELGYVSGTDLAAHFSMSKQGMSAGLKKRGAIKGCRAFECPQLHNLVEALKLAAIARSERNDLQWRQAAVAQMAMANWFAKIWNEIGGDPSELPTFRNLEI